MDYVLIGALAARLRGFPRLPFDCGASTLDRDDLWNLVTTTLVAWPPRRLFDEFESFADSLGL